MIALARALSAEMLKTKRTLTLVLAFLAPLAVVFLTLVMFFQQGEHMLKPGDNPWPVLASQSFIVWGLLMLPLFVTLEMGLLAALEHNNKCWKQLYALPMPRWAIYAAKQVIGLGMIGLSMVVLTLSMVGIGLLLRLVKPSLGFAAPIPWLTLAELTALTFLASWLIISLHLWISLHWSSFVAAMGAGITATVAGVLVINSDWARYDPWTLPGLVSMGLMNGKDGSQIGIELAIGIIGGIVIALAGGWEVGRRDVL